MKLVFDTSPLSCFARADLLDLLEQLTQGHECVVPRAVLDELRIGAPRFPLLQKVAVLPWLVEVRCDTLPELQAFAFYARRLVADEHNIGEATVLACAEVHGGIALLDDQTAVQSAKERGVRVRRTLALICSGIASKLLSEADAVEAVEKLRNAGARFPCDGDGFLRWAREHGLLV